VKSAEEIMNMLDAFDLTGSLRDAGELAGVSHHWSGYDPTFANTSTYPLTTDAGQQDGMPVSGTLEIGPYTAVIQSHDDWYSHRRPSHVRTNSLSVSKYGSWFHMVISYRDAGQSGT
jgi:hypothetical protein